MMKRKTMMNLLFSIYDFKKWLTKQKKPKEFDKFSESVDKKSKKKKD